MCGTSTDGGAAWISLTKEMPLREVEQMMYHTLSELLGDTALPEIQALLWRFIEGRPAGDALARRTGRV